MFKIKGRLEKIMLSHQSLIDKVEIYWRRDRAEDGIQRPALYEIPKKPG